MFKSKKGQGMTLNVVVVAAIVLLVLVVLVLIFTGKIGNFVGESEKCVTKGGTCIAARDGCNRANLEAPVNAKCYKATDPTAVDDSQVCCIKVGA
ncbi:TPA: hypothetical protein HA246_01310 [Candidatus Woesearchaeota archaeon]|nr:hypothetical protein [Candidatus Woesearchaeota archaeon]